MSERDVTVVIPVWNGAQVLPRTLPAMLRLPVSTFVFVNDGSDDATGEILAGVEREEERVTVLTHSRNRGRAAARNTALSIVETRNVAFLDADASPRPGYIEALIQALAPSVIAAVGRIAPVIPPGPDAYQRYIRRGNRGPIEQGTAGALSWKYFITACMLIRTRAVRRAGGFDESVTYGEDVLLALALEDRYPAGLRYAPSAVVDLFATADLEGALDNVFQFGRELRRVEKQFPEAVDRLDLSFLSPRSTLDCLLALGLRLPGGTTLARSLARWGRGREADAAMRYLLAQAVTNGYCSMPLPYVPSHSS